MKYFVAFILFAFGEAGVLPNDSSCFIIRNLSYEKEILKEGVKSPYQLAIDYDTNTLFFSYTARTDEVFKIAYYSLKTAQSGIVTGINGGFASAVNSMGRTVYMGGEDGLYQFNYDTKSATNLHIKDDANLWQMFYKDGLYFTTYPEEKAFLYKDDKVVEVPEVKNLKVMQIAITNDNNIVYSNSSGLFLYTKAKRNVITLSDAVINGFTADIDGNLYFSTPTGIYSVNEKSKQIEELFQTDSIYGLAIEGNGNIIYASEESIIRLKATKKVCFPDKMFRANVVSTTENL